MASRYTGPALWGLLVFGGTALFGLVLAPLFGTASGLFPIDTESRVFFSLLTLKAMPTLGVLSIAAGASYPWFAKQSLAVRATVLAASAIAAWGIGAALALFMLG